MIAHARRSIAVGDAGKFTRSAIMRIAEPGRIDCLICDQVPPLTEVAVTVITA